MKKFLAAFDGFNMSQATLNYAIQLTKAAKAQLVGVFLDDLTYQHYNMLEIMRTHRDYEKVMEQLDVQDKSQRDAAARQFQLACEKAGIQFSIHRDKGIAFIDLKRETMFSDLLLINESETFSRYQQESPTTFMQDLLAEAHCPVLVVPGSYKPVERIVLLYDGSPSSIHAIKMFSYLLGDSMDVAVEVFTVKEHHADNTRLPDSNLMRDYIKGHLPKAAYTVVKGDEKEQILMHLREHARNDLVVLGAYRRSDLSRMFKVSVADILMRELDIPLFIAHNK
ncbi:universal stress protein [Chitinophaga parva]|nr:universal stress protein [Chitinophaga parva]